jgi:hypothetical protein
MADENFTRLGKFTDLDMYDVKLKTFKNVRVELIQLSNGRYAVTGVNPDTGMKMTKLVKKVFAQDLLGRVEI